MAEPGKIEVQLSLLSGEDTAAAKDLADSIKQIAESFKWLKSVDYKQSAENLANLYKKIEESHERVTNMVLSNAPGTGGGPSRLQAFGADLQNTRDERNEQEKLKNDLAQAAAQTQQQSRQERQGLENRSREAQNYNREQQPGQDRVQNWMSEHGVRPELSEGDGGADLRGGGFRIPRFGRLNVQDILNRMRDRQLRTVLEEGDTSAGDEAERRATILQKASDRTGDIYAASHFMRAASQWATQQNINPLYFSDVGAQLGYNRDSNPLSQILGVQTPFSAAGQEGWRQARDSLRLRWQAGINNQQAQEIIQATAGAGFSGGSGSDIRMNLMAPLVRRYGANPQDLQPFLQTLRTSTASIDDLSRVLGDMGDVAKSANLTLSEYNRNLAGSVEATQALGGSALRGMQFGHDFTLGTGLPSSVGDQVSQNPIVQAFTAAQTNVPAIAQGALSAGQRMTAMRTAVHTIGAQWQSALSNAQGRTREVLDPRTGQVVGTEAPGNLAMGAAAKTLGFPSADALSKFMQTEKRQAGVEAFQVGTQDFNRQVGVDAHSNRRRAERRQAILDQVAKGEWGAANKLFGSGPGAEDYYFDDEGNVRSRDEGHKLIADRHRVGELAHDWAVQQHGGARKDKHSQFGELRRMAKDLGVDQDEINKVKKGDTKKLTELVSAAQREKDASYTIAMTPLTKKFFKVMSNATGEKVDWNLDSRNSSAASAPGPAPLGPSTNTGAGPIHG